MLQILKTHGALEELSTLQSALVEKKARLEEIKSTITNLQKQNIIKNDIKVEKNNLEAKLVRDYEQNKPEREAAVSLFNENSLALYNTHGDLIIDVKGDSYNLGIEIKNSSSEGVNRMKIFCFDLMLVELMSARGCIDFLFHDSTLYDGVDSRQRALALMHAAKKASDRNFQYICALNSDMIPHDDFEEDFDFMQYVRLELKDDNPENSCLGFHFEIDKKKKKKR